MKKITCKRRHIFASAIDSGGSPKLRRDPHIYSRYGDGSPQNYGVMGTGVPKSTVLWGRGSPNLRDPQNVMTPEGPSTSLLFVPDLRKTVAIQLSLHIMASTIISLVAKWCGFVSY